MGVFRASQMVDCEIVGLIRCLLAAAEITNASNGGCSGLTVRVFSTLLMPTPSEDAGDSFAPAPQLLLGIVEDLLLRLVLPSAWLLTPTVCTSKSQLPFATIIGRGLADDDDSCSCRKFWAAMATSRE